MANIVGFGYDGTWVSLATGSDIPRPRNWSYTFGASAAAGGWTSQDATPRQIADVNGDDRADIVGLETPGCTSRSVRRTGHSQRRSRISGLRVEPGSRRVDEPGFVPASLGRCNGDHRADIRLGDAATYVALSLDYFGCKPGTAVVPSAAVHRLNRGRGQAV